MQKFSGFLAIGSSNITKKYGISLHFVMDHMLLYNVAFHIPHLFRIMCHTSTSVHTFGDETGFSELH